MINRVSAGVAAAIFLSSASVAYSKAIGDYLNAGSQSHTVNVGAVPKGSWIVLNPLTLSGSAANNLTGVTTSTSGGGSSGGFQLNLNNQTSQTLYVYVAPQQWFSGPATGGYCSMSSTLGPTTYSTCPNVTPLPFSSTYYLYITTDESELKGQKSYSMWSNCYNNHQINTSSVQFQSGSGGSFQFTGSQSYSVTFNSGSCVFNPGS